PTPPRKRTTRTRTKTTGTFPTPTGTATLPPGEATGTGIEGVSGPSLDPPARRSFPAPLASPRFEKGTSIRGARARLSAGFSAFVASAPSHGGWFRKGGDESSHSYDKQDMVNGQLSGSGFVVPPSPKFCRLLSPILRRTTSISCPSPRAKRSRQRVAPFLRDLSLFFLFLRRQCCSVSLNERQHSSSSFSYAHFTRHAGPR
ncbi:unnamed protein product, partial [Ixodes pacificus]